MWILKRNLAKYQSSLEAVRKLLDLLEVIVLGNAVVSHHGAPLLEAIVGVLVLILGGDVLHRSFLKVKHLCAVLVEATDG